MEAILKFDLPEDISDYTQANHGAKYFSILWDLDQSLRNIIKYNEDKYTEKELDMAQQIRDTLTELCNDEGIDLYNEVQ